MGVEKRNAWDNERQLRRGPKHGRRPLRMDGRMQALGSFHSFHWHPKQHHSLPAAVLPKTIKVICTSTVRITVAAHCCVHARSNSSPPSTSSGPRNPPYNNHTKRAPRDVFALVHLPKQGRASNSQNRGSIGEREGASPYTEPQGASEANIIAQTALRETL